MLRIVMPLPDRDFEAFDRSIDVLMSRIRRKLRDNGSEDVIKTVRNGGYQFSASVEFVGAPS